MSETSYGPHPGERHKAAEQLMTAMSRLLREGHRAWEPHQSDPEWDELSGALTAVYMGWKYAAHTGLLPRGPSEPLDNRHTFGVDA